MPKFEPSQMQLYTYKKVLYYGVKTFSISIGYSLKIWYIHPICQKLLENWHYNLTNSWKWLGLRSQFDTFQTAVNKYVLFLLKRSNSYAVNSGICHCNFLSKYGNYIWLKWMQSQITQHPLICKARIMDNF